MHVYIHGTYTCAAAEPSLSTVEQHNMNCVLCHVGDTTNIQTNKEGKDS
jgi:hypothetical protein